MARRPKTPPEKRSAELTADEMRAAITRFDYCISRLQAFDPEGVDDRSDPLIPTLEGLIDRTLVKVFGVDSVEYEHYRLATHIDTASIFMGGTPISKVREGLKSGKETAIVILEEAKTSLLMELESVGEGTGDSTTETQYETRKVFVVHGRDEEAKLTVARFLERIGLEPLVLHEQPDQGRTIIEKFEDYADVGFAVVILTPDDVGAIKGGDGDLGARARENVIFELGFFLGKLGRNRVCVLKKGDVSIPSDYVGVLYKSLDDTEAWKLGLAQEMKVAGLDIDLNKVIGA